MGMPEKPISRRAISPAIMYWPSIKGWEVLANKAAAMSSRASRAEKAWVVVCCLRWKKCPRNASECRENR